MEQNVESLLGVASEALKEPKLRDKLNPDERDRLLRRCVGPKFAVWQQIRNDCMSFDRIVKRVAAVLRAVEHHT